MAQVGLNNLFIDGNLLRQAVSNFCAVVNNYEAVADRHNNSHMVVNHQLRSVHSLLSCRM